MPTCQGVCVCVLIISPSQRLSMCGCLIGLCTFRHCCRAHCWHSYILSIFYYIHMIMSRWVCAVFARNNDDKVRPARRRLARQQKQATSRPDGAATYARNVRRGEHESTELLPNIMRFSGANGSGHGTWSSADLIAATIPATRSYKYPPKINRSSP